MVCVDAVGFVIELSFAVKLIDFLRKNKQKSNKNDC
jgi:hypothetical protein